MHHRRANTPFAGSPNRPATPHTYARQYAEDQNTMWTASRYQMNHSVLAPDQISECSSLAQNIPRWEILPLDNYGGGRGQGTGRIVRFVRPGLKPVLLTEALHEACPDLLDADRPAPLGDHVSTKLSLRIPFPGAEPYTRQITARRSTTKMEPVAYKVLARKIAEDMEKYIDRERKARRPLTYRNVPLELGQLALCELHNISDGSWEPVFMIWTLPKIRRADRAERVPAI